MIINFVSQFCTSRSKFYCIGTCKVFSLGKMMDAYFCLLTTLFLVQIYKGLGIFDFILIYILCPNMYFQGLYPKVLKTGKFHYFFSLFNGFQLIIGNSNLWFKMLILFQSLVSHTVTFLVAESCTCSDTHWACIDWFIYLGDLFS